MSLFSFVKDAGAKLWDTLSGNEAKAAESLKEHVAKVGLGNPNIQLQVEGDKVVASGEVASQEEKEKILLALGNVAGIGQVEDNITVAQTATAAPVAAARFVTVKSGDTLSSIAKAEYGDANAYMKIFEANKPMLGDPNKIYPGQVLRIPQ
ncbi:peptidoglycan-binding protein LysM [Azotobacter bryophylli]|uniref:Peptidoglycan-binding protein LysM n=1 Tax=Azotobacter bryophylli TaxID=1986537 RepID=A0ABV7AR65_9GAMM